jgi:hypothetical protein
MLAFVIDTRLLLAFARAGKRMIIRPAQALKWLEVTTNVSLSWLERIALRGSATSKCLV